MPATKNSKPKSKCFTIEKKLVVQVRYYEELYVIRDNTGQRIYTGSPEAAARILNLLNGGRK